MTCPAGLVRAITSSRQAVFGVACRDCPLRRRCTASQTGRTMKIHEHEALLRAARRQSKTEDFQHVYRQHRPMVERSIAWLVRAGNRKVRYRGIAKNDQWLHHRLAGINLRRMLALGLNHQPTGWAIARNRPNSNQEPARRSHNQQPPTGRKPARALARGTSAQEHPCSGVS